MTAAKTCFDAPGRLAAVGSGKFLLPHHLEAARRLSLLLDRAQLRQRVTMSCDPTRVGAGKGAAQSDLTDSAADARRKLTAIAARLPADCWGILVDVCLYEKGFQDIETERGWPRRAAKLVLRIALDQVAATFGLNASAEGRSHAATRSWLPERPAMFTD
ncbi:hypothetical protein SAMN06295905_0450 [Devosia lucknowensis]|uniref:DUF6456 domain-containing protein n=1 Tax=Devosia lucknowensis TaxID=1096929 RepID=A0A1Y6EED5_9HYPH|nr:DUF6456 domain-containing protein [Devosia lucknowensis]SMQ60947.1 hypothetical protein SAMN06295905_0450 [Devosia lucknowensis]